MIRIGEGELGLENHLVRYSVDVEQLAFDRGIDERNRQTRPHPGLPVRPVQGVALQVLAPMVQFAQGIRHDFYRAQLERPVDFLARGKYLAVKHRGRRH